MAAFDTEIRQGRKFDQVLDGARHVFIEAGYERASMDEIARAASVSKATLYAYFPDKSALFREVYRAEILRLADSAMASLSTDLAPQAALRDAARQIITHLMSDFAIAMYRICVGETPRFPEIGQVFYENGPELGRQRFGAYLRAAVARGDYVIADIDLASDQFFQLCQTTICDRLICGVQTQFSEDEITRSIDGAVSMFLARYGRTGLQRG